MIRPSHVAVVVLLSALVALGFLFSTLNSSSLELNPLPDVPDSGSVALPKTAAIENPAAVAPPSQPASSDPVAASGRPVVVEQSRVDDPFGDMLDEAYWPSGTDRVNRMRDMILQYESVVVGPVRVVDRDVRELLQELSDEAGILLWIDPAIGGTVSLTLTGEPEANRFLTTVRILGLIAEPKFMLGVHPGISADHLAVMTKETRESLMLPAEEVRFDIIEKLAQVNAMRQLEEFDPWDLEEISDLIRSFTGGTSWDDREDVGIRVENGVMIILQSADAMDEIRAFMQSMGIMEGAEGADLRNRSVSIEDLKARYESGWNSLVASAQLMGLGELESPVWIGLPSPQEVNSFLNTALQGAGVSGLLVSRDQPPVRNQTRFHYTGNAVGLLSWLSNATGYSIAFTINDVEYVSSVTVAPPSLGNILDLNVDGVRTPNLNLSMRTSGTYLEVYQVPTSEDAIACTAFVKRWMNEQSWLRSEGADIKAMNKLILLYADTKTQFEIFRCIISVCEGSADDAVLMALNDHRWRYQQAFPNE